MNFEKWYDTYQPKYNKTPSVSAPFGGTMYETFGDELKTVIDEKQKKPQNIWTLMEQDGVMYISNGFHLANRLGYFITEKPFDGDCLEVRIY